MVTDSVQSINDEKLAIDDPPQDDREEMNAAIAALLTESARGFDILLADFRRDCRPADAAEDALVQLMARSFWHALRKTRIETGLVESQIEAVLGNSQIGTFAQLNDIKDPGINYEFDTRRLGLAFDLDCGRNNAQLKMARVTALSDAGFHRAHDRLLKMQIQRKTKGFRKLDRAA